jgi:ribosome maturation factor RimP
MNLKEHISGLTNDLLEDEYFLVDMKISDSGSRTKIEVFIDGDKGISIDKCSEVSRKLSDKLEEMDELNDGYVLDVGSPGLDMPLKNLRQYKKNIGRTVNVHMHDNKSIKGKLRTVTESSVEIEINKKKSKESILVDLENIQLTKVLPSFK